LRLREKTYSNLALVASWKDPEFVSQIFIEMNAEFLKKEAAIKVDFFFIFF